MPEQSSLFKEELINHRKKLFRFDKLFGTIVPIVFLCSYAYYNTQDVNIIYFVSFSIPIILFSCTNFALKNFTVSMAIHFIAVSIIIVAASQLFPLLKYEYFLFAPVIITVFAYPFKNEKLNRFIIISMIVTTFLLMFQEQFFEQIESEKIKYNPTFYPVFDSINRLFVWVLGYIFVIQVVVAISIQHKALKIANRNERLYRSLFDNSFEGIFLYDGKKQSIKACNASFDEMFQQLCEKSQVKHKYDLVPEFQVDGRSSKEHMKEHIQLLKKQDGAIRFDFLHQRQSGEIFETETTLIPNKKNRDEYLVMVKDISKQRKFEKKLKQSEAKFRDIFENIQEAIVELDENRKIISANNAANNLFGMSLEKGFYLPVLIHPESQEEAKHFFEKVKTKERAKEHKGKIITPNGQQKFIEVNSKAKYDKSGNFIGTRDLIRDITESERKKETIELFSRQLINSDPAQAIQDLLETVSKRFQIPYVYLSVPLSEKEGQIQAGVINYQPLSEKITYDLSIAPCNQVVQNEQLSYYKNNLLEEYHFNPIVQSWACDTYLGIPVRNSKGKLIGTLAMVKNGSLKEFDFIVELLEMHASWIALQLERLTYEKALQERQATLNSVINSMPDGVYAVDKNFKVIAINKKAQDDFYHANDYKIKLEVGCNFEEQTPIELMEDWKKRFFNRIFEGETFINNTIQTNRGKEFFIENSYAPVTDSTGNVIGLLEISRDITPIKKAENQLIKRNEELKRANQELDQFVYSAAHDLRAPITSVLGLIDICKHENDIQTIYQYLDLKEKSLKQLDDFIRDIVNYSRNARQEIKIEKIEFQTLIEEIFEQYAFLENANIVKQIIEIEQYSPLFTDKHRLKLILSNLISNAIRYMDASKNQPYIQINAKINLQEVLIQIKDNGQGISPEHIQKVFQMFYRANQKAKGSGIGLYITQQAIEKLEGKIKVQSEYREWTNFSIEFKNHLKVQDNELIHA